MASNINQKLIIQSFQNQKSKKIKKLLPWKYPYTIERENIENALNVHYGTVKIYKNDLEDRLELLLSVRTDSIPEEIESTMGIFDEKIQKYINKYSVASGVIARKLNVFNKNQLDKIIKNAFNVNMVFDEPWVKGDIDSYIIENTSLITKMSNETRANIGEIVQRGFRNNDSWVDITEEINQKILPNNGKRAKLIGRDQVNKLNGQFTKQRQTDLGLNKYTWRTALDEKVRIQHSILEGLLCSWQHPDKIIDGEGDLIDRPNGATLAEPGQDIQCRCHAEMYFNDILNLE